jgi:hypothetical protein
MNKYNKTIPLALSTVKSNLWKLQAIKKSNKQWTFNSKKIIYKSYKQ